MKMQWDSYDFHSHLLKFNEQIMHKKVETIPVQGKVTGLSVSISSFWLLHVEAYFKIHGKPLCYTNSGSCGAANRYVPVDIEADEVELWVWAHNMTPFFKLDFHVKYEIHYEGGES